MKKILAIILISLCSFTAGEKEKEMTVTLTMSEWQIIYGALGKLPAEQSELIRAKIAVEYSKTVDTTKK